MAPLTLPQHHPRDPMATTKMEDPYRHGRLWRARQLCDLYCNILALPTAHKPHMAPTAQAVFCTRTSTCNVFYPLHAQSDDHGDDDSGDPWPPLKNLMRLRQHLRLYHPSLVIQILVAVAVVGIVGNSCIGSSSSSSTSSSSSSSSNNK